MKPLADFHERNGHQGEDSHYDPFPQAESLGVEDGLQCRNTDDTALQSDTQKHTEQKLFVSCDACFQQGVLTSHVEGVNELGQGKDGKAHGGVAAGVGEKRQ